MRMYQVDAFTDRLFAGNPAAVLVLDDWLADDLMLSIAQENNLAETAYVKRRTDGAWDLRWFTPTHEVEFCGHATLATAHVLLSHANCPSPAVFHTRVGELRVTQVDDGYRLDVPCLHPEPLDELPGDVSAGFPATGVTLFRSFENFFVDLGSAQAVRDFTPDLDAIAKLGVMGLVVTGKADQTDKADFVSRYFAPGAGIPEDPVTGSIHATLVPYWADKFGRSELLAYQASARGGWIDCQLTGDRVYLTGHAITYMQADLFLS